MTKFKLKNLWDAGKTVLRGKIALNAQEEGLQSKFLPEETRRKKKQLSPSKLKERNRVESNKK